MYCLLPRICSNRQELLVCKELSWVQLLRSAASVWPRRSTASCFARLATSAAIRSRDTSSSVNARCLSRWRAFLHPNPLSGPSGLGSSLSQVPRVWGRPSLRSLGFGVIALSGPSGKARTDCRIPPCDPQGPLNLLDGGRKVVG
ncbi:hypothetical protein AAur_3300 [Paenarthrobacter aurescens TC1]|uniref:Uncharacterized protein n=1 Tax=Paenarthrobacter aurescens (strain TC1) TaxID=290340 RepID=A1R9T4_PAEAT|nr:hypothetical protein AAur_3300 [Paenarthrobacter aurescens TC1]